MDRAIDIITNAARLPPASRGQVKRIVVEPTADSEGRDAFGVTIVLEDEQLTGSEALSMISGIQRALLAEGDERLPIIEFATEDDLKHDGDPEP